MTSGLREVSAALARSLLLAALGVALLLAPACSPRAEEDEEGPDEATGVDESWEAPLAEAAAACRSQPPRCALAWPGGAPRYDLRHRRGALAGPWRGWYRDGRPAFDLGADEQGRAHGPWRVWHPDGSPWLEGSWQHGARTGPWRVRYPGGADEELTHYRRGRKHGRFQRWHPDGAPAERASYVDGARQGEWTVWWPDGTKREQATFVDGEIEGPWTEWHPNGVLRSSVAHLGGDPDGPERIHDRDGAPLAEGHFRRGVPIGEWRCWTEDGPQPVVRPRAGGETTALDVCVAAGLVALPQEAGLPGVGE